jgi:hypothetical protein
MSDGYDGHTLVAKDREIAALRGLLATVRPLLKHVGDELDQRIDTALSGSPAPDPAEAMRAACEAIMQAATNNPLLADGTELDIATIDWLSRRIAALKGGEPTSSS